MELPLVKIEGLNFFSGPGIMLTQLYVNDQITEARERRIIPHAQRNLRLKLGYCSWYT